MAVLHGIKALSLIIAAMAFTISCSSGDSKDDDGGGGSSSSNEDGSSSSGVSIASCPNPSVSVNSMSCGGQSYRTVNINDQVWMAENLNYNPGTGNFACYDNDPANCVTYGRLYDWSTAKGVCPSGWHLPSSADWDRLYRSADGTSGTFSPYGSNTAGRYLKATSGWNSCGPSGSGNSYLCEDTYGFSALPGGLGYSAGTFIDVGAYGYWWSSSDIYYVSSFYSIYQADGRYMYHGRESAYWEGCGKALLFSVRCLKD